MSLQLYIDAVDAFHKKMGVLAQLDFPHGKKDTKLLALAQKLIKLSEELEERIGEPTGRYLRAHLELEELGEELVALARGDFDKYVDGQADHLYVLLGSASIYDVPLDDAFAEVHRSNMTKTRKLDDPGRVRDKGTSFKPPDIRRIVEQHHARTPRPNTLQQMRSDIERAIMRTHVSLEGLSSKQEAEVRALVEKLRCEQ